MTDLQPRTETPGRNVVVYSGHRLEPNLVAEQGLQVKMEAVLDERYVGLGVGSLAAGADILWAETLLVRGAELEIVLPFAVDSFLEQSVRPCGAVWVGRFHEVIERCGSVTNLGLNPDSEAVFRVVSDVALARALTVAHTYGVAVSLAVVWDGTDEGRLEGTGADVAAWRRLRLPIDIIASQGQRSR